MKIDGFTYPTKNKTRWIDVHIFQRGEPTTKQDISTITGAPPPPYLYLKPIRIRLDGAMAGGFQLVMGVPPKKPGFFQGKISICPI